MENKKIRVFVLVFLIVALGFFLRIYNISNAPPGVYPDEAVNGMDAVTANQTGDYQWFYPANQGREGLMMNLVALCFKLFGISVLSLRLPSIVFGTLAILGTYLLGKELFNTRVGLISSFLVSVGYWAINFNRISFRANLLPFILVFSFYFLFKGLRTKKWSDFAIGGFIFGMGLHTYIAFRIAPLILVVSLISLTASRENFLKDYWKKILIFIVFVTLAAAPMLYTFFWSHPEYFASRSDNISVLSPKVNQGHLLQTFLKSFTLSLAKYNFWGDQNWRHNYPPYPILDPLTGIAFLFGIIYSFIRMTKLVVSRFFKKSRDTQMDIYIFLIAWFFAMLVPEFMTSEGNPHALRSIGTLPAVFLFSGVSFDIFLAEAEKHTWFFKKLVAGIAIFMLVFIGFFNAIKYHYFWANKIEAARSFDKNIMEISDYIKTLPLQEEKYIVAENMQRIPIQLFNQGLPNVYYVYTGQTVYIEPKDKNNFIVVFTDKNDDIVKSLQQKYPNTRFSEVKDAVGMSYYTLAGITN
jgi:4-amino-4-deoxy-L-arabinose transferase-like glycosyltransferase